MLVPADRKRIQIKYVIILTSVIKTDLEKQEKATWAKTGARHVVD